MRCSIAIDRAVRCLAGPLSLSRTSTQTITKAGAIDRLLTRAGKLATLGPLSLIRLSRPVGSSFMMGRIVLGQFFSAHSAADRTRSGATPEARLWVAKPVSGAPSQVAKELAWLC